MLWWQQRFLDLAAEYGVLKFGEFTLKSGRQSPYFFNVGEIGDGAGLKGLGECYAEAIEHFGLAPDCLFGPAYKGIPIAVATGVALQSRGRVCEVAFDRKEAKDHGEKGMFVGGALDGRVLIVDDVMSSGSAVKHVVELLATADVRPAGVLVALDRQERGVDSPLSAVQQVAADYEIEVRSVVNLTDVESWLATSGDADTLEQVKSYRSRYGVA